MRTLLFAISIAILSGQVTPPLQPTVKLDDLRFLSGCWAMERGKLRIEEQWSTPSTNDLTGMSRTLRDGKTVFHEFIRIELKDGQLTYTPRIGSGAKPVIFRLLKAAPGELLFENPEHDFPQRILYRKTEAGLNARIEGTDKGKERAIDYPYLSVACEAKSAN